VYRFDNHRITFKMDFPTTAPGPITRGSQTVLSERREQANLTRRSLLTRPLNTNSSGSLIPVANTKYQQQFKSPRVSKLKDVSKSSWNTNTQSVYTPSVPEAVRCKRDSQTFPTMRLFLAMIFFHLIYWAVTNVKNWVISFWFPRETTTEDTKSNQTNTVYNPTTVPRPAAAAIKKPEVVTCPAPRRRFVLRIKINGLPVTMTIDSGCHISIIGNSIWRQMGQPILEPVMETWSGVTGSQIEFEGKFMANVNCAGKSLQLPLYVMKQSQTTNLLGRVWFPSLHLDWNRIFNCLDASRCQPDSDGQRQLALKMIQTRVTGHFYVAVNVEGKTIPMVLDTGASVSLVSQSTWEELGKPPLMSNKIPMIDANEKEIPDQGECQVKVKYNGREGVLPLVITTNVGGLSILGTDWFQTLQFNFNSIFKNINFHSEITPATQQTPPPQNDYRNLI
jgi:predicted aspartyl protease